MTVNSFLYHTGNLLSLTSTPFGFDATTNEIIVKVDSAAQNGDYTFTFRQKPDYLNENTVFFFYIFDVTVWGVDKEIIEPIEKDDDTIID